MAGNQEAKNHRTALGEASTPERPGRTAAANLSIRKTDDLKRRAKDLKLPREDGQIKSQKQVQDCLIMLIYGSNRIESAGASLDVTGCLCRDVFRGKTPTLDVEVDDQARKEIVGHAKALLFMMGRVVIHNEPWSEELILECHRILYTSLDDHVVAGQYRDHEVAVAYGEPGKKQKRSICIRAGVVSGYMKEMVMQLNDDVKWYENAGQIDPYTFAARYHHRFAMIHPFGDGNGRMSRIILNTLLLKYASQLAPFGSTDEEKKEYLDVVGRCRKIFDEEDTEVDFVEQTSHQEFASFVLAKARYNVTDTQIIVSIGDGISEVI